MNELELSARVIALESALNAMLLTRDRPTEAYQKFNEIWTASVRTLNQTSPDNAALTQAIQVECNKLGAYFRAYSTV